MSQRFKLCLPLCTRERLANSRLLKLDVHCPTATFQGRVNHRLIGSERESVDQLVKFRRATRVKCAPPGAMASSPARPCWSSTALGQARARTEPIGSSRGRGSPGFA